MSKLECPSSESTPLLLQLHDKKQTLRRFASEVGCMASELKDVRSRMASQESTLQQEITRRQTAEARVKAMEMELEFVKKNLEEKEAHAISASTFAEQYLRELVDARSKLRSSQDTAVANGGTSLGTQLQHQTVTKEMEIRTEAIQEHEPHTSNLGQHIHLQEELRSREVSEGHLEDEIERLQTEKLFTVSRAAVRKEPDAKNIQQLGSHFNLKEDLLRDEIKHLSVQLKIRTKELQIQIERHRAAEQDLKKRVLKLEFWLQESRSQTRRLQKVAERQEKELKDIQARIASNTTSEKTGSKFWSTSKVKIIFSVSVMALIVIARR